MEPTRIWFARHGEVEEKWVGSFIGKTDVPLSDLGHHQAAAIAAYLEDAPIDAIVSSPRKRALDTAAPLAKAKGMKLDIRPAFAEMHFGEWDGLFWDDIQKRDPLKAMAWETEFMHTGPPNGESGVQFSGRVAVGLDDLLKEFQGRTIALFAHAGTCRAILAHTLRRSYHEVFAFGQDYGNVSACAFDAKGVGQVALWNFVPGPRAKRQGD